MTNRKTNWTSEQVALVVEFWPTKTARQIAHLLNKKFGTKYTRNAVIGKCMRYGLVKPQSPSLPRLAKVKTMRCVPPPKPVRVKIVNEDKSVPHLPWIVIPESSWDPLPNTNPINIMALNRRTCRWPVEIVGAAEQMYCGTDCNDRYCSTHTALGSSAYQTDTKLFIRSLRQYA
jgi:hypothetical protein